MKHGFPYQQHAARHPAVPAGLISTPSASGKLFREYCNWLPCSGFLVWISASWVVFAADPSPVSVNPKTPAKAPVAQPAAATSAESEDAETQKGRALLEAARKKTAATAATSWYEGSILLSYNGDNTILPLGSILHLPAEFNDRIVEEPTGRRLLWPEFLEKNISWIRLQELPPEVVRGLRPVPVEMENAMADEERMVVAVLRKMPITVLQKQNTETK